MKAQYLKNVATLRYDAAKCIGCGRCAEVCPHAVFAVEDRLARVVDRDRCMECGACALNCPTGAIAVHAGVGCAGAILLGMITGKEPSCGGPERREDGASGASCC